MKHIFSLFLFLPFFSNAQDTLNCEEFLDKKIYWKRLASEVMQHTACLSVDSIDLWLFFGLDAMERLTKGEEVEMKSDTDFTYRELLEKIHKYKKTDEYHDHRKLIIALEKSRTTGPEDKLSSEKQVEIDTFGALITLEQVLKESLEKKKPILLFFTGYGCVNAHKMESEILGDSDISHKLRSEFISYRLLVDDKTPLPPNLQYYSETIGRNVKTIGRRNYDIQAGKFQTNVQPYFVIIDAEGKVLTTPLGYTNREEEFIKFLESGLMEFRY